MQLQNRFVCTSRTVTLEKVKRERGPEEEEKERTRGGERVMSGATKHVLCETRTDVAGLVPQWSDWRRNAGWELPSLEAGQSTRVARQSQGRHARYTPDVRPAWLHGSVSAAGHCIHAFIQGPPQLGRDSRLRLRSYAGRPGRAVSNPQEAEAREAERSTHCLGGSLGTLRFGHSLEGAAH